MAEIVIFESHSPTAVEETAKDSVAGPEEDPPLPPLPPLPPPPPAATATAPTAAKPVRAPGVPKLVGVLGGGTLDASTTTSNVL